jgi:hypothetical protein
VVISSEVARHVNDVDDINDVSDLRGVADHGPPFSPGARLALLEQFRP